MLDQVGEHRSYGIAAKDDDEKPGETDSRKSGDGIFGGRRSGFVERSRSNSGEEGMEGHGAPMDRVARLV